MKASSSKTCEDPPRIAFWGNFGSSNLGNECTLQALISAAGRHIPSAELVIVCPNPIVAHRLYSLPAIYISSPHFRRTQSGRPLQISLLRRFIQILLVRLPIEILDLLRLYRVLKSVDLLAMPGTGIISDFANTPFQHPYELFRWSLMARLCGCRVRFISAGVGPINAWLSKAFFKGALALADYRSYRDDQSRKRLGEIGFHASRDRVCPDLAFSLPATMFSITRPKPHSPRIVAVGVMDYRLGKSQEGQDVYLEYISKSADLVQWLLSNGNSVRIVHGDTVYDRRPRQDLLTALAVRGIRPDSDRLRDVEISCIDDLISQLAATDVVVSPRFHNLLLALMLRRPVISLSYDPKNDALLKNAGLGTFIHPLEKFDVKRLIGQFKDLLTVFPTIESNIDATLSANRALLEQQFELVFADLVAR